MTPRREMYAEGLTLPGILKIRRYSLRNVGKTKRLELMRFVLWGPLTACACLYLPVGSNPVRSIVRQRRHQRSACRPQGQLRLRSR